MTTFQVICSVAFLGLVAAAYGKDIYARVKPLLNGVLPRPNEKPDVPTGVADATVRDLVAIAELRDRLDAENCKNGADACSLLLKIIIDHKHPYAG